MKILVSILLIPFVFIYTNGMQKKVTEPFSHFLSIYAGPNIIIGDWDFGFNSKLNWELRKESEDIGFGVFAETNIGKYFDFSFGIPVTWHNAFTENLYFFLAPGIFFTKNINYTPPYIIPENEQTTQVELFKNEYRGNFMLTLGAGLEFPLQNNGINFMIISPNLNFNLISQTKIYLNLGVSAVLILR